MENSKVKRLIQRIKWAVGRMEMRMVVVRRGNKKGGRRWLMSVRRWWAQGNSKIEN